MVINQYYTVIMTIVLFLLSPCATSLTFHFPSFPDNGNNTLSLEGDASIDGKLLRLTKTTPEDSQNVSVGRATYTEPFLLRESATGNLADFSFAFVIDSRSRNGSAYGDALAFLLAPLRNSSARDGGGLGLPYNSTFSNEYPLVVEFYIFQSENAATGDRYRRIRRYSNGHVGVRPLSPVTTKPWYASMKEGHHQSINSAKVRYYCGTKNLTVAFPTYDDLNGTQVISYLSHKIHLAKYLADWVVVGISIPTGRPISLHKIISWNYVSSSLVDFDLPLEVPTPTGLEVKPRKHKRHVAVFVGSIVGGFMLVGVLGLGLFNSCKRKVTEESSIEIPGLRRFSYGEIALATRNFAEGEKLGDGVDGEFYRGFRYDMNSYVTVKRMSKGSTQRKEYISELMRITSRRRLRHHNLMPLIGWCYEQGVLLLIFNIINMPKGSLDFYLRKADNLLIWEVRYKIAQDLAWALRYLHEEWEQCVHSSIQSSNILLDSNLSANLGIFLLTESQTDVTLDEYIDPAYLLTGETSKMSDVYSFGVVALEIACGRKPIDRSCEENEIFLVDWVRELYREGKIIEAADRKLRGDYDRKQMECLMVVGLWCTHSDPSSRPSIVQAIQVLSCDAPLPLLTLSNDTTGSSS